MEKTPIIQIRKSKKNPQTKEKTCKQETDTKVHEHGQEI